MPPTRTFTSTRQALEFDGAHAGFVHSAEGGDAFADVLIDESQNKPFGRKYLGPVRYTDIVVRCGSGMGVPFWELVGGVMDATAKPFSGAIVGYDMNYIERDRLEFTKARVSAVTFPTLDRASKDAVLVTVTIEPGAARRRSGSGAAGPRPVARKPKPMVASNFRVQIDGLESALTTVRRVEALSIVARPASVTLPNLVLTLAASTVKPFATWHEDVVVAGNRGAASERAGSIELLTVDQKDMYLRLAFAGLGISALGRTPEAAGADKVAHRTVAMYCQRLSLASFPSP